MYMYIYIYIYGAGTSTCLNFFLKIPALPLQPDIK